jgi:hypothetical protein
MATTARLFLEEQVNVIDAQRVGLVVRTNEVE